MFVCFTPVVFQALRERCEELEKEKLELGCGVKARESEASRFGRKARIFFVTTNLQRGSSSSGGERGSREKG